MKVLTLQIKGESFKKILSGEQKKETRAIWPSNANRHIVQKMGEPIVPVIYDALYLINGRRKDSPRLLVEVIDTEFYVIVDEKDNEKKTMK
jgi:hypothetical protein